MSADYSPAASTERSAARLAHQSGGLGVASSNLAAPTIAIIRIYFDRGPPPTKATHKVRYDDLSGSFEGSHARLFCRTRRRRSLRYVCRSLRYGDDANRAGGACHSDPASRLGLRWAWAAFRCKPNVSSITKSRVTRSRTIFEFAERPLGRTPLSNAGSLPLRRVRRGSGHGRRSVRREHFAICAALRRPD